MLDVAFSKSGNNCLGVNDRHLETLHGASREGTRYIAFAHHFRAILVLRARIRSHVMFDRGGVSQGPGDSERVFGTNRVSVALGW